MKKKKLKIAELQNLEWILPNRQTPSRQLFDETLAEHGLKVPENCVETSSMSMVRGLLLESDRVALLSEHQIYYDKLSGQLNVLPVELSDTYRPIGITMRAHTQPSPAAQLFLDQLRAVALEMRPEQA